MRSPLRATLTVALAFTVLVGATRAQDEKPTEKVAKKEKKPTLEEAIARAFKTAKKNLDDQRMIRSTVLKGMRADDDTYLVVCEFQSGDLGIFEGGLDPQSDQWIVVQKDNLEAIEESAKRAHK
jgi:hypothetical protein